MSRRDLNVRASRFGWATAKSLLLDTDLVVKSASSSLYCSVRTLLFGPELFCLTTLVAPRGRGYSTVTLLAGLRFVTEQLQSLSV